MAKATADRRYGSRTLRAAETIERASTIAPLVLRLPLGVIFLAHGLQKLLGLGGAAEAMEAMGFAPGMFWAFLGGVVETVGGAGLLLGLLTRLCALVVAGMQLVAMLVVHLPNGFFMGGPKGPGIELNLALLGGLGALVILGSGTVGLDAAIRRKNRLETTRTRETTLPG